MARAYFSRCPSATSRLGSDGRETKASFAPDRSWLLLTYKVPPEPAKRRIALWRKLKGLGAVYLQNGVCLLPKSHEHVRRLKVIENEIADMDGEAVLLETVGLNRAQQEKVVARFAAERNEAYAELITRCDDFEAEITRERAAGKFTYAEVEENDEDLKKLLTWLDKIRRLDFTGAACESRGAGCAVRDDLGRIREGRIREAGGEPLEWQG